MIIDIKPLDVSSCKIRFLVRKEGFNIMKRYKPLIGLLVLYKKDDSDNIDFDIVFGLVNNKGKIVFISTMEEHNTFRFYMYEDI